MPDHYDFELIQSGALRSAMMTLQDLLGKSVTDSLIETLNKGGLDPSNNNETFYIREIRDLFEVMFGIDAAELLMQRIGKELTKKP